MSLVHFRLIRNVACLVLISALLYVGYVVLEYSLRNAAVVSGFLLLAMIVLLTSFNARKKIPGVPLIKVSTWTQIHIYMGYLCFFVFLLHLDFALPQGVFEILLALAFIVVTVSGVVGLAITVWLPKKMAGFGPPLTYELIPSQRVALKKRLKALVLKAEMETESSTVSDLYIKRLHSFFEAPATFRQTFLENSSGARAAIEAIESMQRYLSPKEQVLSVGLLEYVGSKRDMDAQEVCQRLLKCWLFVHIPATYSMIVMSAVHVFLALSFGGSV